MTRWVTTGTDRLARPYRPRAQGGAERFRATGPAARAAITRVVDALRPRGWTDDYLGSVEIVLAEIVNNVVEHAYRGQSPGFVGIRYSVGPRGLCLVVSDRGQGFSAERLPPGAPMDFAVPPADLPEGGFGWLLIRSLAPNVRYRRDKGVNRLRVRFPLPD